MKPKQERIDQAERWLHRCIHSYVKWGSSPAYEVNVAKFRRAQERLLRAAVRYGSLTRPKVRS